MTEKEGRGTSIKVPLPSFNLPYVFYTQLQLTL